MHSSESPGLKRRKNKDGTTRLVWVARAELVKKGYTPKTVRLHYDEATPEGRDLIASACRRLQAEMLAWAAGYRDNKRKFDGTIAGLVREYETHEASPHKRVKWNTRRNDQQVLTLIEKAFGKRVLAALKIEDFYRWHSEAAKPKTDGGPRRLRRAYGIIKMLRQMFKFGVSAEIAECKRLVEILTPARFPHPKRRREKLELHHVEAFIKKAVELNRVSLALGTAGQFETGMRQRDWIGEWEPIPEEQAASGIVLNGRRWVNGLTWADLANDLVISKETTKTGAIVAHDLKLCPLFLAVLAKVPAAARVGPVIIDETEGRPYAEHAYAREWRIVARAAGIPDRIWNMDARAGAITEAEDAGAELDEVRSTVGHKSMTTTAGYSRGPIGKSKNVMKLRAEHRAKKHGVND